MNSREFFTQALLSCHKVLMEGTLPDDFLDDDDFLEEDLRPLAEQIARIATVYATELAARWETCIQVQERQDQENPDIRRSTENLTRPPPDPPPSSN
jgi:hypothetical protein